MIINSSKFTSIYISIAVLLSLAVTFTGIYFFNILYILFAILGILVYGKINKAFIYLAVMFVVSFGVVALANETVNSAKLLYGLSGLVLGYLISGVGANLKLIKPVYVLVCLLPFASLVINFDINNVFVDASRNMHSVLVLALLSVIVLSQEKADKANFYVLLAIISLPMLGSRSAGISAAALICIFIANSNLTAFKRIVLYLVLLILIFLVVHFGFFEVLIDRVESQGATDYGRLAVLNCYANSVGIENFILGFNYPDNWDCGTKAIGEFAPHNSYLSSFIYSGFFGVVILCLAGFTAVRLFGYKSLVFFVFSAFMLRCFTDDVIFFNRFDYIFWGFYFSSLRYYRRF